MWCGFETWASRSALTLKFSSQPAVTSRCELDPTPTWNQMGRFGVKFHTFFGGLLCKFQDKNPVLSFKKVETQLTTIAEETLGLASAEWWIFTRRGMSAQSERIGNGYARGGPTYPKPNLSILRGSDQKEMQTDRPADIVARRMINGPRRKSISQRTNGRTNKRWPGKMTPPTRSVIRSTLREKEPAIKKLALSCVIPRPEVAVRVFSGLPFSGFSSFRAFENFVRVFGSGLGLFYSSKICKFEAENAI